MRDALSRLALEIRSGQAALRAQALEARKADPGMIAAVGMAQLSISVCAVDGGLLAFRLHGHDVVASRSVGVNFVYERSLLSSFCYHPGKTPQTEVSIKSALDEHEANVFRSLVRLKSELACAIACLGRFSPKLMLLDGSLWTVPADRPTEGSELAPLYAEVVGQYKRLYAECDRTGATLCGVVKDSRSRKLADSLGFSCSDTLLADHMLGKDERTSAFPYFDKSQKEPDGFWDRLKVFYIKPSEQDLPLRIEYLAPKAGGEGESDGRADGSDEAASLILSLSSISEAFAYPAILIEADMRAAMDPAEAERLQADISALDIRPLRRNSRPFR